MALRPEVFISAAAPEFNALRKTVKHALLEIGARPLEHADFSVEYGQLHGVLSQMLGRCTAVIHLLGYQYGQEPAERTLHAPRRSFTHYEVDVAQKAGLPVYTFAATSECALLPFGDESPEAQALHERHRAAFLEGEAPHAFFTSPEELGRLVRGLRSQIIVRRSLVRLPGRPLGARFIGRNRLMHELREGLTPGSVHLLQPVRSLMALGGAGASSLAMELAWRLHDERRLDFIFWLSSGLRADFEAALAALARTDSLELLPDEVASHHARLHAVRAWFRDPEHAGKFLVVVDGVDTENAWWSLRSFLPEFAGGVVLLTGRMAAPPGMLVHAVPPFSAEQARDFLISRLGLPAPPPAPEEQAMDRLAEMLGRVPLSIALAAGHLAESKLTPRQFIASLAEGKGTATMRGVIDLPQLFDRSLAAVEEPARALLRQLVCLAPEPAAIPLAIFEGRGDAPLLHAALSVLERRQFLQRDESSRTIRLHRTVRELARDRLLDGNHASDALAGARPVLESGLQRAAAAGEGASPGLRELLMPHCRALLGQLNGHPLEIHATALTRGLADWLSDCGRATEAEVFSRRALAIDERRHGSEHEEVAARLRELAGILRTLRRFPEAETHYRRAVEIEEALAGPDAPEVAASLYQLAACLRSANRLDEAGALCRRALRIEEEHSGPAHPKIALAAHRLAGLLEAGGRVREAEQYFRRALAVDEAAFGPEHPRLTSRLYHLGRILGALGRAAEGLALFARGLALEEKKLGPDHAELAPVLAEYAVLLEDAGRVAEAEKVHRRALALHLRWLGGEQVETALVQANLAAFLVSRGAAEEAVPLLTSALGTLAGQDRNFRGPHPHLRSVTGIYATVLAELKRTDEEIEGALKQWQKVAPKRERSRFPDEEAAI